MIWWQLWVQTAGVPMYQYPWELPAPGPQKGSGIRQRLHSAGRRRSNSRMKSEYMFGPEITGLETLLSMVAPVSEG
jgi:hypothetical protein